MAEQLLDFEGNRRFKGKNLPVSQASDLVSLMAEDASDPRLLL